LVGSPLLQEKWYLVLTLASVEPIGMKVVVFLEPAELVITHRSVSDRPEK
jgi:hypothetical protein